jgi:peptidylprolyl isomerase
MSRTIGRAAVIVCLLTLAAAPSADDVVAKSGDIVLTTADARALIAHSDPATRARIAQDPAALVELVRSRVLQLRLLTEAQANKWDQNPDVVYRVNQARDSIVADTYLDSVSHPDSDYPSDADIAAAYEANKARFVIPRQYHLLQIFIAVPADAPARTSDDAQKKLRDLQQQLAHGRGDFATTASQYARDARSGSAGGDLGWVREDQLVPAVKTAVAGLAEGATSDPVRTQDGWHLLKLLATRPAGTQPLPDVHDAIADALRRARTAENARRYLDQMQRTTPVQVNEIALSHAATP